MILTCASCSTRYYADDASIGPNGRSVRCAACGHSWFVEPQLVLESGETAAPPALTRERVERMRRAIQAAAPEPSAAVKFRQQQADRQRRERVRMALFAWTGAATALAASAAGAVAFRQDVAEVWPRSASAFAALGLDVNVYGLEMYDLTVERAFEGATPVLLISGEVRNIGREEKAAPPLRVTLRDAQENPLYQVVYALDQRMIAPGGAAAFQVRVENPPLEAVDLETTFAAFGEEATVVSHDSPLELTHDDAIDDGPVVHEDPTLDAPHGETASPPAAHAPADLRSTLEPLRVMEGHG